MTTPAKLVQPIHFEDLDGKQFERLVFGYHVRTGKWSSLDWYGQLGSDMGRDIWGVEASTGRRFCIQCANRKLFSKTKAITDINKVLTSLNGKPDVFRLVCASSISAKSRDETTAHARAVGIKECDIWSGNEFEERLRGQCESLLARFVGGETFPDSGADLKRFVEDTLPPCNVPHAPAPYFVEPGKSWKELQELFTIDAKPAKARRTIVLHGLHGTGKTQAASMFAWDHRAEFSAVLWVRGDSLEVFRSSFGRLCDLEALDLPEQETHDAERRVIAVRKWLKVNKGWLMVIDNVDRKEVRDKLLEWVPPSFRGSLLITSCLSAWRAGEKRIEFGSWGTPLCTEFLKKRLNLTATDEPAAADLGRVLGGLPLALEQSAAYIEQTRSPLQSYLRSLKTDIRKELARSAPGSTDYPASFAAVLRNTQHRLTERARFVLELAAFLAPKGQFMQLYEMITSACTPERIAIHGINFPLFEPRTDVEELGRWSLVRQMGEEFDIHPLVQCVVRENLSPAVREHRLNLLWRLLFSPFGQLAAPNNSKYWINWAIVYPHMEAYAGHLRENGDKRALGYLCNHMGLFLESQGVHQRAVSMLSEAVDLAKATVGPESQDTGAALNNLGEMLMSIGQPAEARTKILEAIKILDKSDPLVQHARSSVWSNLGLCYGDLGETEKAEKAFRKALEFDAARNGLDDDYGLIHQNNLANLLSGRKQLEEAEKIYRNVVAKMKDEARLSCALTNLGGLLYRTGRASEAVVHLERSVRILLKFFPPEHPSLRVPMNRLLLAKRKLGLM